MRKIMILSLLALLFSIACTEEEPKVEELTFADIEQEFNFTKPHPETSKKLILERYGTVENYREALVVQINKLELAKRSTKDGTMYDFKVTLKTPDSPPDHHFECDFGEYILDVAEELGIELPYSCRAGACSTCTSCLESGSVDMCDQSFLDDDQIANGFILICVATPTSDCVIETHQEDKL